MNGERERLLQDAWSLFIRGPEWLTADASLYLANWIDDRLIEKKRFMDKVDQNAPGGCWEWTGTKHRKGYGLLARGGKLIRAHRESYRMHVRDPGDQYVLHRCDNPPCVNPAHLYIGDHNDNMRDMVKRGRSLRGNRQHDARLNRGDVIFIRESFNKMKGGIGTARILSKAFDVSEGHIHDIVAGRKWKHVPLPSMSNGQCITGDGHARSA